MGSGDNYLGISVDIPRSIFVKVDTRYDPAYSVVGERVYAQDPFYLERELYLSTDVILDLRDIAAEAIECTTSFDSDYATDYERDLLKRMATSTDLNDGICAWIEYLLWVPTAQRYLEITWRLEKASLGTPYEDLFCVSQECLDSRTAIGERAPQPWDWSRTRVKNLLPEIPTNDPEEWARTWYEKYWVPIIKSPEEVSWGFRELDLHNKRKQFIIETASDTNKIEKESAVWTDWSDITPQVVGPAMLFYTTAIQRNLQTVINWG